jgi:DNA replication and repair protein RecF
LSLVRFQCTDFRCLESVELEFGPSHNLIYGPNAAGKTSILEAIAYLGRGRSFRGAGNRELVRHGQDDFILFGKVRTGNREISLGVRNGKSGLEVRTNGEKSQSAAPLAEALPLQVVDPDVHDLVAGGPEGRRRYIDWLAFHVEPGYLDQWRRFRRALKQRNAALRSGAGQAALAGWDEELGELGTAVDQARRRMVDIVGPAVEEFGENLLGSAVDIEYVQGWPAGKSLREALEDSAERDLQLASTQAGPHRADLRLGYDERQARKLVSRGQQKLLACAMILAATETVQTHLEKPLLLLLDDPAAELDRESVSRLMGCVEQLGSQVVATTLDPDQALFSDTPTLFHVEQGVVERAA